MRRQGSPTIHDVARRARVSAWTVSKVLNEDTEARIPTTTRQRVLRAAQAVNYRPNRLARSLRTGSSMLGILIPNPDAGFFPEVIAGFEEAAAEKGYECMVCHAPGGPENEQRKIELLLDHRVEGLMLYSAVEGSNYGLLRKLTNQGFPLVLSEQEIPGVKAHAVWIDYATAIPHAVSYLTNLGHRDIVLFLDEPKEAWEHAAVKVFLQAMRESGIPTRGAFQGLPRTGYENSQERGYMTLHRLLEERHPFTSLIVLDIHIAVRCYAALADAGIAIPTQCSILCLYDYPLAIWLRPPLTAFQVNNREYGRAAARLLLDHLERRISAPQKVLIPATLLPRGSTAAAPAT